VLKGDVEDDMHKNLQKFVDEETVSAYFEQEKGDRQNHLQIGRGLW
jgi:hypothetical protein